MRARVNTWRKRLSDWLWPWPSTRRHVASVWVSMDLAGTALFAEEATCRRHAELRGSEVREIRFGESIPFHKYEGPEVLEYFNGSQQAVLLPEGTFIAETRRTQQ